MRAVAALQHEWLVDEAERFVRAQLGKSLERCYRDELLALSGRGDKLTRFLATLASRTPPGASLGDHVSKEELRALAKALMMENVHA
jgi:hypothetical protein